MKQQVLVVDDDENDAFFIARAFQDIGITQAPHVSMSVRDAIAYLEGTGEYADRKRFPFPNLLITDLKMPVQGGFDLLRWIRDHPQFQVIPTVIMSSSDLPEDVKCAYCLGANAYMCKPVDSEGFKRAFAVLLEFWHLCEVPEPGTPTCEELIANHS